MFLFNRDKYKNVDHTETMMSVLLIVIIITITILVYTFVFWEICIKRVICSPS